MELPKELKGQYIHAPAFYIQNKKLTEEFMEKYIDFLDWKIIVKWVQLNESFIEKHADLLTWDYVLLYQRNISDDFIVKHKDKFTHWDFLGVRRETSVDLVYRLLDKINWPAFSSEAKLSDELIREFADKLEWTRVTIKYSNKFTEQFMREMKDYIDWYYLFRDRENTSMNFIREIVSKLPKRGIKYTLQALGNQINNDNFLEIMEIVKNYNIDDEVLFSAHSTNLSDETIIKNYQYFNKSIIHSIRNGNISNKLKRFFKINKN